MKKQPRYYQVDAKKAIYAAWREKQVPYVEICTGGGKSLICADITQDVMVRNKRVIQLVSTKKLVSQNNEEAVKFVTVPNNIGIVCNKLNKIQNHRQAVIAMTKSFYKYRATSGAFDVCLVDECDLVSPLETTQYRKIIKSLLRLNPGMLIGGLTASPYRDDQGMLHDPCKKGMPLFTDLVYSTPMPKMMEEGYLSNITNISGKVHIDLEGVHTIAGDYSSAEVGVKFDAILSSAVADLREKSDLFEIQTAVIFASTVANAYRIAEEWGDDTMRVSHGKLTEKELDDNLEWLEFGQGRRFLVNVGLYIRGFDYQQLQMVGLFLATKVISKYVQIVGRVLRSHDDKPMAYIWDVGTNIARLGPIDALTPPAKKTRSGDVPKKPCIAIMGETIEFEGLIYRKGDECGYANLLSAKKCKVCGALYISGDDGNYSMQSKAQVLKAKQDASIETFDVSSVYFEEYVKDGVSMIKMLLYDEYVSLIHTDYICIEHTGVAKNIATGKIMALLKDKKSYYEMGKHPGGVCVKTLLFLLGDEYYDKYFKAIKQVTLMQDGRFKKLISWSF